MKQLFTSAVLFAILTPIHASAQGIVDGFLRGKGNTTVALSYTSESGSDFFIGSTKVTSRPFGRLKTESASIFLAHGLTNDLDLVVSVPWIRASADGDGAPADDEGLQDLAFYLKWRPWQKDFESGTLSWIGALGAQIPLSDYVVESPVSIGQDSNTIDAKMLLHYVTRNQFFVDLGGGYLEKEDDVPDAVYGSLKLGYFTDRMYFDVWYEIQDSTSGNDVGAGPFRLTEVDYTRTGGTAYFDITGTTGVAFSASRILDGKNIKDFTSFSTSLVFNFGLRTPGND